MTNACNYYCPCCGFRGLEFPAYHNMDDIPFGDLGDPPYEPRFGSPSFQCCACCGFEYGYDDDSAACGRAKSFDEYLAAFIADGCQWFYPSKKPADWSIEKQLEKSHKNR